MGSRGNDTGTQKQEQITKINNTTEKRTLEEWQGVINQRNGDNLDNDTYAIMRELHLFYINEQHTDEEADKDAHYNDRVKYKITELNTWVRNTTDVKNSKQRKRMITSIRNATFLAGARDAGTSSTNFDKEFLVSEWIEIFQNNQKNDTLQAKNMEAVAMHLVTTGIDALKKHCMEQWTKNDTKGTGAFEGIFGTIWRKGRQWAGLKKQDKKYTWSHIQTIVRYMVENNEIIQQYWDENNWINGDYEKDELSKDKEKNPETRTNLEKRLKDQKHSRKVKSTDMVYFMWLTEKLKKLWWKIEPSASNNNAKGEDEISLLGDPDDNPKEDGEDATQMIKDMEKRDILWRKDQIEKLRKQLMEISLNEKNTHSALMGEYNKETTAIRTVIIYLHGIVNQALQTEFSLAMDALNAEQRKAILEDNALRTDLDRALAAFGVNCQPNKRQPKKNSEERSTDTFNDKIVDSGFGKYVMRKMVHGFVNANQTAADGK